MFRKSNILFDITATREIRRIEREEKQMKYYLFTVQYNKTRKAENRPQPRMFNELKKAESAFYKQVGADMDNEDLGGSLNMVVNSEGGRYDDLKRVWGIMEEPQPEPQPETVAE